MKNNVYGVILAGGKGSRLWPLSKQGLSKSFFQLADKKPLISNTIERVHDLIDITNILCVVDASQSEALKNAAKGIPGKNILIEPFGRSTASAVGLAAINVHPDSILVVLPTDAFISDKAGFVKTLKKGIDFVSTTNGVLVAIGIKPTEPSTAYGYIKIKTQQTGDAYFVDRFTEKPSKRKADIFLKNASYLWNSGIFIFRAKDILSAMKQHAPMLYAELVKIKKNKRNIESAYSRMQNTSIDYQIMENAKNLYCIKADFSWRDLGNWVSVESLFKKDYFGNVVLGKVKMNDTRNTFVYNQKDDIIGIVGLDDMIVVNAENGILVCSKKDAEKVKALKLL